MSLAAMELLLFYNELKVRTASAMHALLSRAQPGAVLCLKSSGRMSWL